MDEKTELIKRGEELIKEGELEIKEGEAKIKDGKDHIKDGEELIKQGKLKIEEGKKKIEEGKGNKGECSKDKVFPYKLEWYQSEVQVVVEVLVKNMSAEKVRMDFQECTVLISLNINDDCVRKELNLLHEINPSRSTYRVLPSKIEIKLAKKDGGHWTSLEKTEQKKKQSAKNWDKVVAEMEEETKDSDAMLNELFQKIYSEGSDEVKKAMNKSFLESGGTELNTNWDAVKKGTVSVKPPQGMEWKSWES